MTSDLCPRYLGDRDQGCREMRHERNIQQVLRLQRYRFVIPWLAEYGGPGTSYSPIG